MEASGMTTDRKIDMAEPEAPTLLDPDALKAAQNCFGDAVSWGCEAYEALGSAIVEYLSRAALVSPAVAAPAPHAWAQWARVTEKSGAVKRIELLTAKLPFAPDAESRQSKIEMLGEPLPLYALPIASAGEAGKRQVSAFDPVDEEFEP